MMFLSLVAMTRLEKCFITSVYLQWLFHSGLRAVALGPLVTFSSKTAGLIETKLHVEPLWDGGMKVWVK